MKLPDFVVEDADGFVHFTGHRVGLAHLIDRYNDGFSPEMLLGQFPILSLALIHKAIAFYLENRGQVDEYVAQERRAIDEQSAAPRRGPDLAELRRRSETAASAEGR